MIWFDAWWSRSIPTQHPYSAFFEAKQFSAAYFFNCTHSIWIHEHKLFETNVLRWIFQSKLCHQKKLFIKSRIIWSGFGPTLICRAKRAILKFLGPMTSENRSWSKLPHFSFSFSFRRLSGIWGIIHVSTMPIEKEFLFSVPQSKFMSSYRRVTSLKVPPSELEISLFSYKLTFFDSLSSCPCLTFSSCNTKAKFLCSGLCFCPLDEALQVRFLVLFVVVVFWILNNAKGNWKKRSKLFAQKFKIVNIKLQEEVGSSSLLCLESKQKSQWCMLMIFIITRGNSSAFPLGLFYCSKHWSTEVLQASSHGRPPTWVPWRRNL